jgi:signal transduction histidine kinase
MASRYSGGREDWMSEATPNHPVRRNGTGLSAKLLWLTVLFVMIAEVLIYVPSIANFRLNWLNDRIAAAQTAALVLEAAPDSMISSALEAQVLQHVGARTISLKQGDKRRLLAFADMPGDVVATYDIRSVSTFESIRDAFMTLSRPDGGLIRIIGMPPAQGEFVEIVVENQPLWSAMWTYSGNILLLSLFISGITAALVYLTLHVSIVRPIKNLSGALGAFRDDPENPLRVLNPSDRRDELGDAERALAVMQRDLQAAMGQKNHLAALGLAVAKINHDLRNILASAQLFSDRLSGVKDPTAQRLVPKVISALDRAIALCQATLTYGKAAEPAPQRRQLALAPIVEEVAAVLAIPADGAITFTSSIEPSLMVDADPDQLFRVLLNLARNAYQALQGRGPVAGDAIRVAARRQGSVTMIEIADTGPGIPERARDKLFRPFQMTVSAGGTGLGLAIASELVKAHGGSIKLVDGTLGATFQITIPDRTLDFEAARSERRRA